MRQKHSMTWNMARNTENVTYEKCTLQDLEFGKKTDKRGKGETHILGHEIW